LTKGKRFFFVKKKQKTCANGKAVQHAPDDSTSIRKLNETYLFRKKVLGLA
jgi:hypothetical protein